MFDVVDLCRVRVSNCCMSVSNAMYVGEAADRQEMLLCRCCCSTSTGGDGEGAACLTSTPSSHSCSPCSGTALHPVTPSQSTALSLPASRTGNPFAWPAILCMCIVEPEAEAMAGSLISSCLWRPSEIVSARVVAGQWLGPWTLCHTLQQAVNEVHPAGLIVHLANTPGGGAAPVLYAQR